MSEATGQVSKGSAICVLPTVGDSSLNDHFVRVADGQFLMVLSGKKGLRAVAQINQ